MVRRVLPAEKILLHQFGKEAILLNLGTETYYTLNSSGVRMWRALTTSDSVEDAVQSLLSDYEVEAEELRADVNLFIDTLQGMKLLSVQDV